MSKSPTHAAYPYLSPKEAAPQAKAAARKALEIDSSLAEAHMALGFSLVVFDWNWAEAEREFEKALELNPNSSVAHYRYGFLYLAPLERYDHAITELKRALELEPLSLITNANLAGAYTFAGQNDLALKQARKTYELEPNFVSGHYWLALAPINLITALRIPGRIIFTSLFCGSCLSPSLFWTGDVNDDSLNSTVGVPTTRAVMPQVVRTPFGIVLWGEKMDASCGSYSPIRLATAANSEEITTSDRKGWQCLIT